MSSIIRTGDTCHGISVDCRGVFTNDEYRSTYAGQCKDGYACGLGVTTYSSGSKVYAEHGPDGKYDGRNLYRWFDGDTWYGRFERGEEKACAIVSANGTCMYNGWDCTPDDPRVLALIALVAPVEVRPAAPAPHPPSARHSDPKQSSHVSAGSFCPRRRSRRPRPPRCNPHAASRRWWPFDTAQRQAQCNARPRIDACTRRFDVGVAWEATLQPPSRAHQAGAGRGSVVAMPCPAHRRAERCHARRAALCSSLCTCRTSHTCRNLPLHAHPARLLSGPDALRGIATRTLRAHRRRGLFPCASPTLKLCRWARQPGFAVLPSRFGLAG
jgi:hypothetical protein